MQAMILEEDPRLRSEVATALTEAGLDVAAMSGIAAAKAFTRHVPVDVLVLGEQVAGCLAHDVALLAEWRNPLLAAVVLSDRSGPEVDELFDLLPSLAAILGRRIPSRTIVSVALGAVRADESAQGLLARRWAEVAGDEEGPDEPPAPEAGDDAAADDFEALPDAPAPVAAPFAAATAPPLPSFLRRVAPPAELAEPAPVLAFRRAAPVAPAGEDADADDVPLDLPAFRRATEGRRLHLA